MFQYFPENYSWSLAVMMAVHCGGAMAEIDDACRPLIEMSRVGGDPSSRAWADQWRSIADRVDKMAEVDRSKGWRISAGRKSQRACAYSLLAERMMSNADSNRPIVYRQMLRQFRDWQESVESPVEHCKVPFGNTYLPALFVDASSPGMRAPCMVMFDGFDIMKEVICMMGIHDDFRRRGVSLLIVDNPGVGEALRLQGLHGSHEYEIPASACLDYLERRPEVSPDRVGMIAPSAGGYAAVRAAALDPRFACCVAWTGVWDYGTLFERRMQGSLALSVHYQLEHAEWVYGVQGLDSVLGVVRKMTLEGIADKLRCPLLVSHGENDRQTPVSEARRVIEGCVNSPARELHIVTHAQGGDQHCHVDNQHVGTDYMADWVALTLGGRLAPTPLASSLH